METKSMSQSTLERGTVKSLGLSIGDQVQVLVSFHLGRPHLASCEDSTRQQELRTVTITKPAGTKGYVYCGDDWSDWGGAATRIVIAGRI